MADMDDISRDIKTVLMTVGVEVSDIKCQYHSRVPGYYQLVIEARKPFINTVIVDNDTVRSALDALIVALKLSQ